jgi:quinoprotein glucose dehydrogenase
MSRPSASPSCLVLAAIAAWIVGVVPSLAGRAQSGAAARTVWDGVFTAAQAERGRGFYLEHCAQCHGANLQGDSSKALSGDKFWADFQETTLDYLLNQISRNMPHSEDGSLKGTLGASTYVDIVAHILDTNRFPAGARELTQSSSAGIQIVRKDGPAELPSGSLAHVVGCLARGADRSWKLLEGSRPVRVLSGIAPDEGAPLGDREYTLMFVLTSLDKFVGHRMSVRATLMGDGGTEGLNVAAIRSVSATCE